MEQGPTSAMILAAGLGQRMRPLTLQTPKPLIKVGGKAMIDYGLQKLLAADVANIVVNKHWLPDQIEAWARRNGVSVSDETDEVLDTGGGIARALQRLGQGPFYVLNSDCFWIDRGTPALRRLAQAWDDVRMDCLLLLCDPKDTTGYDGKGDFALSPDGRLARDRKAGLVYMGAYIVHPRLFQGAPQGAFSMNELWNRAMAQGRLFGLAHDGHWLHVGTPEAIPAAEAWLKGN